MGLIVNETGGIKTVGELMFVLAGFDDNLPLESRMRVYQVTPEPGESVLDPRGRVVVSHD